jgi:2-octaprenyl-6-methoxyphenol hydroxylase
MFDILIIGAGLVGSSLACGLRGWRVGLIDSKALLDNENSYDERIIALAFGSRQILNTLGIELADACPIHAIHVSDLGYAGQTRLAAQDIGLPALGYVSPARSIANALRRQVLQSPHDIIAPAEVTTVEHHGDYVNVGLNNGDTLQTRLLVVADGGGLAQQLGVKHIDKDYRQTALIARVKVDRPHRHIAYERFTNTGPLALLPLAEREYSLVWTLRSGMETDLQALTDRDFLALLQQRFGWRAGRFSAVSARHAFPLRLRYLAQPVQQQSIFIGNAAHTLHPVAGQGLNLGLRDVTTLIDSLAHVEDPGAAVARYARQRQRDLDITIRFTDSLIKVFSNQFPPLVAARTVGLFGLNHCQPLKRLLMWQTTGLAVYAASPGRNGA